jgi:hypothetical protein
VADSSPQSNGEPNAELTSQEVFRRGLAGQKKMINVTFLVIKSSTVKSSLKSFISKKLLVQVIAVNSTINIKNDNKSDTTESVDRIVEKVECYWKPRQLQIINMDSSSTTSYKSFFTLFARECGCLDINKKTVRGCQHNKFIPITLNLMDGQFSDSNFVYGRNYIGRYSKDGKFSTPSSDDSDTFKRFLKLTPNSSDVSTPMLDDRFDFSSPTATDCFTFLSLL